MLPEWCYSRWYFSDDISCGISHNGNNIVYDNGNHYDSDNDDNVTNEDNNDNNVNYHNSGNDCGNDDIDDDLDDRCDGNNFKNDNNDKNDDDDNDQYWKHASMNRQDFNVLFLLETIRE